MALPSSGQISFNDVRIEMSQSAKTDYAFGEWAKGYNELYDASWTAGKYAPINVLSSGSRFSLANRLTTPLSMSAWYSYNHTASITSSVTGTLYLHWNSISDCYASTMLIMDVGTTNTTYSINISGSQDYAEWVYGWYGKPWKVDGSDGTSSLSIPILTGSILNEHKIFDYNYTYDSNKGRFLYFIVGNSCP